MRDWPDDLSRPSSGRLAAIHLAGESPFNGRAAQPDRSPTAPRGRACVRAEEENRLFSSTPKELLDPD